MYSSGCGLCPSKSCPGQHNIYKTGAVTFYLLLFAGNCLSLAHVCPSEGGTGK